MNTLSTPLSPVLPAPLRQAAPAAPAPAEGGWYRAGRKFDSARSLAALLLAAAIAALVVVAGRLVNTWADGHLFAAWVFLWAVVLTGLALFAGTARRLAKRTVRVLDAWSQARAMSLADARLWQAAQNDLRVMAELRQAQARCADAVTSVEPMLDAKSVSSSDRFPDRLAAIRVRNMHYYYV